MEQSEDPVTTVYQKESRHYIIERKKVETEPNEW